MKVKSSRPAIFFDNFTRKPSLPGSTHYCPGCGHGILQKILGDAIDELGVGDRVVMVAPVGCAVFIYYYFRCSSISVPHGRAPAVATGIGRCDADSIVVSYQGDGDLAAIGTNNIIHAANRGENMLVLFANNNTYGMTGGQLAPTTLLGQVTATSPRGRDMTNDGPPIRMAEIMATLGGPVYVERVALSSPANIRKARRAVLQGLRIQQEKKGFAFVEVLNACPTNWHMTAPRAMQWIEEEVIPVFPLKVFKDETGLRQPSIRSLDSSDFGQLARLVGASAVESAETAGDCLPFGSVRFKGAGFGGQGILSMGLVLAQAALYCGLETTWLPSYGPEMRGGVANCSVVIDKQPIASPVADTPNLLIAMNAPSLEKFGPEVAPGGVIVYNSSMINKAPRLPGVKVHAVDATNMAESSGDVRAANSVMIGFMARITGLLDVQSLEAGIKDVFPGSEVQRVNLAALRQGWEQGGANGV